MKTFKCKDLLKKINVNHKFHITTPVHNEGTCMVGLRK